MENQANVVVKKENHSRGMLSGIFRVLSLYVNQAKCLFVNNLYVEDPRVLRTAKSGMTTNLMGFTLIELLVVVLIIGILAAVAVPQYKLAVAKAQATQALILLDSIYQAEQIYFLAHGTYSTNFHELDVELPQGSVASNSPDYFYAPWGHCVLQSNGIWCIIDKMEVQFAHYLSKRGRLCRAYCDKPQALKLCQSYNWRDVSGNSVCENSGGYKQFLDQ